MPAHQTSRKYTFFYFHSLSLFLSTLALPDDPQPSLAHDDDDNSRPPASIFLDHDDSPLALAFSRRRGQRLPIPNLSQ